MAAYISFLRPSSFTTRPDDDSLLWCVQYWASLTQTITCNFKFETIRRRAIDGARLVGHQPISKQGVGIPNESFCPYCDL